MVQEAHLRSSDEHPFLSTIAEQLGQEDPTDLIVDPEAVLPNEVSKSFDRVFDELEKRALSVRDMDHLLEIAEPFVTTWTNHNAAVYNRERYPARIKEQARHTTPLRDVEITKKNLENMETALEKLPKGSPHEIYKMYVLAGSGSEKHWFEMYFTPEGVKLAQTAAIMMQASFEKPKEDIEGRFFAMPEYQDVTQESEPIELIHMGADEKANIFVGGTTYPGEVYKPVCKMLNAWVYLHGGAEIHGAGVLVEYPDPKTGEQRRKMVVISGLSLHGKTTLSVADLSDEQKRLLAESLGTNVRNLQFKASILHDDYVFVKPTDEGIEIGVYAPSGIFPAMFGEEPDNPITSRPEAILFNTTVSEERISNFKVPFYFRDPRTGEVKPTTNLRAAAPLEDSFPLNIVEGGVVTDITDFVFITLTRDPAAPSAIKWQTDTDALRYFAALIVAPTDATVRKREGFDFSFACSEFDVAERGRLLARLHKLFDQMRDYEINVSFYTMNTGSAKVPESLAARDAIIMENGKWEYCKDLDILYTVGVGVLGISPYVPWQKDPETDWVKVWEDMRERRRAHFAEVHVDLKKAGLGKPTALI